MRQSEGAPAIQDPEATHDFVMDTLDAVLDRVDKAADNGYIEIKNLGKAAELRPEQVLQVFLVSHCTKDQLRIRHVASTIQSILAGNGLFDTILTFCQEKQLL